MKCHAGVEFPSGTPCPKCNAELGEVCWPGINADLLELPKLRKALEGLLRFIEEGTDYELQHAADYSAYLNAKALSLSSPERGTPKA